MNPLLILAALYAACALALAALHAVRVRSQRRRVDALRDMPREELLRHIEGLIAEQRAQMNAHDDLPLDTPLSADDEVR